MGNKLKIRYILILVILVLLTLTLALVLFLTPSAKAMEKQVGIETSFYSVLPEPAHLPEGATPSSDSEIYIPHDIPVTGTFFGMDYDKVAAISLEQIIYETPYNNPMMYAFTKQTLVEYTVQKGEEIFDELFDYLNSFRYRGIEKSEILTEGGISPNRYDLPFGLRIIPEPDCGEYVRQYPFYASEIRSGDFWYIAEEEKFFQKLYVIIEEKGTVIGPYHDPFSY